MTLLQTKKILHSNRNQQKMKRQPTEWEKIFTDHIFNKRLISKIYKDSYNSIAKKQLTQFKKCTEKLNRHFSKEDRQMANIYMKRCSTSLVIREMQIKTTLRYHFTLIRMAIIKMTRDKCWQGYGEKGNLVHY